MQRYNVNPKCTLFAGNAVDLMRDILPPDCVDLTVTSPPYDNLRNYNGYTFDYEAMLSGLYRVTKPGGVVVWVVGDATVKGSETGTSFRQALYAMSIGFNLHDTMIWYFNKPPVGGRRYANVFEYMFIFSKGKPNTFNPLIVPISTATLDRKKYAMRGARHRNANGDLVGFNGGFSASDMRVKDNIWHIKNGYAANRNEYAHPAKFPAQLAEDHILSWSNPNDIVFDPMMGSGTTGKMALLNERRFIGCDISSEYVTAIAIPRIQNALAAQEV